MLALFPLERRDEETLILNKIVAGEKIEHFETVRRHRDGHLLDVSITVSPIRDGAGRIIGASKIARDISEQRALFNAARQFEAIVASSDDAIISKSLDGTILSWNAGAQAIFGFSADEMVGHRMCALVPPERKGEEDEILRKLRAGEKVDHVETLRRCKDGRLVAVSVTSSPIRDARGSVVGSSKIARDITLQKRAEARLELTARVFSGTHEGILITDANGLIVEVNEPFLRISGYRREEVLGQSPLMFSSSRQGPEVRAAVGNVGGDRQLPRRGMEPTQGWRGKCRLVVGQRDRGLRWDGAALRRAGGRHHAAARQAEGTRAAAAFRRAHQAYQPHLARRPAAAGNAPCAPQRSVRRGSLP